MTTCSKILQKKHTATAANPVYRALASGSRCGHGAVCCNQIQCSRPRLSTRDVYWLSRHVAKVKSTQQRAVAHPKLTSNRGCKAGDSCPMFQFAEPKRIASEYTAAKRQNEREPASEPRFAVGKLTRVAAEGGASSVRKSSTPRWAIEAPIVAPDAKLSLSL